MSDINIQVTSILTSSERRISLGFSLKHFKKRLELITGVPPEYQQLLLYPTTISVDPIQIDNQNDDILLSSIPELIQFSRIHVNDTRPDSELNELVDNKENKEKSEFFQLNDEEYNKKTNTVRSWKLQNKLGRFNDNFSVNKNNEINECKEKASNFKINDRCKVIRDGRIGTIKYIGTVEQIDKEFIWVGIEFDDPVGKNDGSIKGHYYFNCKDKFGGFLKANAITFQKA